MTGIVAGQRLTAATLDLPNDGPSGAPTTSGLSGTVGGTTETMDSVLGVYQWVATAGVRYEAIMNGLIGNGTSGDIYVVRLRYSPSNATPTTSSTIVAEYPWHCPATGTGGRQPIPLRGTFLATASGVNTIAFFSVRASGVSNFTPVPPGVDSGTLPREMFVRAVGLV